METETPLRRPLAGAAGRRIQNSVQNQNDNSVPIGALGGTFPKTLNPSHNTALIKRWGNVIIHNRMSC